ncbi:MAG: exonuclease SbcCD subunit D [Candidatus Faecousia sp.]|nr:exonuclease SbcCD subunit D [Candidatus Faecousia sp.]
MKLLHLSDLHLGKRLNEFSLVEDQKYILNQILEIVDREAPDALVIAGDVYDKAVPSVEAVGLFDDFLVRLAEKRLPVFVISGNHDSPERISFGSRLLEASGIHLSPVYGGQVEPITLQDEFGPVHFYLLPFVKPIHVRRFFPEEPADTYSQALSTAISHLALNPQERNVLVTHQFVTGALRSDSEEISLGGADHVDSSVFRDFDYVALGHLHSPQNCGSEHIRYCGTPLKYSFSEAGDEKSVTIVELGEKGCLSIRTAALKPLRELVELRGSFEELTSMEFYEGTSWQEDYTHLTLTDEEDIPDALGKLRLIYRGLMKLDYDNARTRFNGEITGEALQRAKSPLELFADFYELQNNRPMTAQQLVFLEELITRMEEN